MTVAGCPQPQGLPMTLSLPSSRHPSPSIRARVHSAYQAAVVVLLFDISATPLYASKSSGTCPSSHHRRARCIAPTYSCADPAVCPFLGLVVVVSAFRASSGTSMEGLPRARRPRRRRDLQKKKEEKMHSSRRNPRLLRRVEICKEKRKKGKGAFFSKDSSPSPASRAAGTCPDDAREKRRGKRHRLFPPR